MYNLFAWILFAALVTNSSANNTSDIPECVANDDCPSDRVCARQKCVDPCAAVCGPHTVCHVTSHVAMCACAPGHTGHPALGCSPAPTVPELSGCRGHDQCPSSKACIQGSCADPCVGLCGGNTTCTVRQHIPACACKQGHLGDPFVGCSLQDKKETTVALVKMIATPVIFTNGNGGGSDEIEAFASDNHRMFDAHGNVCAAWWVPYDNIPDLSAIHFINVEPSGTQVKLHVRGVARTGRIIHEPLQSLRPLRVRALNFVVTPRSTRRYLGAECQNLFLPALTSKGRSST